jgi:glycosyltransferase involved in cell wall biosynthesis
MKRIRASIAMAVFNGEKYLESQLESIIKNIGPLDEVIISDDNSVDKTLEIIERYSKNDNRIKYHKNKNGKGTGSNFQNAIKYCQGDYIFYSDQDDVWFNNKIDNLINELRKSKKALIIHNGYYTDKNLVIKKTLFKGKKISTNPIRVLTKNRGDCLGCCMAFKKRYKKIIIPFPNDDHDVWTMSICSLIGGIEIDYNKYIYHRMHENNISTLKRRPIHLIIIGKIKIIYNILKRIFKYIMI